MPTVRKALSEDNQLPAHALVNTDDESEGGFPFAFLDFNRWLSRVLAK